ncbi:hypothetical protein AN1V17_21100 [Vallitalea sediminicola]
MKKLGFRIVVLILLISMLVSFTYIKNKENMIPTISKGLDTAPIMIIQKNDILYNVMYPYINEMDMLTGDCYTNFSSDQVIELYITSNKKTAKLSYEIIDTLTGRTVIKSSINKRNITIKDEYTIAKIIIPKLDDSDYPYTLNITYNESGKTSLDYYQHFYLQDNTIIDNINDKVITFHKATFDKNKELISQSLTEIGKSKTGVFNSVSDKSTLDNIIWNYDKDIVKMNEPIIRITNIDNTNNIYEVELAYTIAVRANHEFEYWDFVEKYELSGKEQVTIDSFDRKGSTKTDPYYDESSKHIVIGSGGSDIITSQEQSDNMRFYSFVKSNQLWLFDNTTNKLTKIFGFDKLDSDYLVDSYNAHKIKINSLDNEGNINYMVYGYMNTGKYQGDNGIAVYEFNYFLGNNENLGFVGLPYGFDKMEYYISNYTYLPIGNNHIYTILDGGLYQFDFANRNVDKITDDIPYDKNSITITKNKNAIFWNEKTNMKSNKNVRGIVINGDSPKNVIINDSNYNNNLIGNYKDYIIIGYYDIQETIEKLDGEVSYFYNKIQVLDSKGKVTYEYTPSNGNFYSDVYISTNGVKLSTIKKVKKINANPRYSKIILQTIRQEEVVLNTKDKEITYIMDSIKSPLGYDIAIIESDNYQECVEVETKYTIKNINKGNKRINYNNTTKKEHYQLISQGKLQAVYDNMTQALNGEKYYGCNTYILKSIKNDNKIMFENSNKSSMKIQGIPVIPQKPELPRGCEVTSLAMLLNYYRTDKLDKMQMADEVIKDNTQYSIIDGMINFGDPHTGFVGDIANVANKGYSVYNEPIIKLAEKYTSNILNISGSNLEDVLYYVSRGNPVWVSTPNIYNKVPMSSIQQWVTPNGIMEISYTSHSVLVIGYDDRYVYFNDPSKNMLRKKPINDFKNGWEDMGRQALLIYQ